MKLKPQDAARQVADLVDRLGDPKNMTKRQWIEFLGEIEADCEAKREAAQDELREDGGGQ